MRSWLFDARAPKLNADGFVAFMLEPKYTTKTRRICIHDGSEDSELRVIWFPQRTCHMGMYVKKCYGGNTEKGSR